MLKTHKIIIALAASALAVSLAACEGSNATDDQQAVADTFTTMTSALVNEDATSMCSVIKPEDIQSIESAGKKCPDVIFTMNPLSASDKKDMKNADVDASKIEVNGDNATIPGNAITYGDNVQESDAMKFVRTNGKWYLNQ